MKKIIIVVAALVMAFIGVGGVLPALAKVRDVGAIPNALVGSYTLGIFLLTVVGVSTVFYTIKRRTAA